jgi:serine/threonine protein kinase
MYTHEVVTLWYRAPEVLLGAKKYSTPLDVWSIGGIFAELANKKPLLPGDSEYDQLMKTFQIFGTPNEAIWPGVSERESFGTICHLTGGFFLQTTFPQWPARSLKEKVPTLDAAGLDLLARTMVYDPAQRISTKQMLKHAYFNSIDRSLYSSF